MILETSNTDWLLSLYQNCFGNDISSLSNLECKEEGVKERRRKNSLPNIDDNLLKILKVTQNNNNVVFISQNKSAKGLHNGVSDRRSHYIGVLRNRHRWQVLINEGKQKKYIGTYKTEEEAALVHDFYCIGINGINAKTNFAYTGVKVSQMIEDYYKYGKKFNPIHFLPDSLN